MSNQCPVCDQEAMGAMTRLVQRPHVCKHCGAELRMNLVYIIVLSLIYFALAVRTLIASGFTGQGMLYVLLITAVYIVICLFLPLERAHSESET